ncbi:DUF2079 domain-containing protein [Polynucleobacter hallstattensis]|uniref:DUF2079 domain-containing protein n=1 Tax=Polynucleobacter hallstattensis TaxID=1855586 RepID=UPI001C0D9031|nr:DUF2079 domain-containing protein [Polynucleobacter hallstattensis]MBU3560589.1 DUF2079 domain-containing protein [Polynucleobacter hallstattensis]
MAGDSAGYVDLIQRVSDFGDMRSKVFASAYSLYSLIGRPFQEYCSNDFINQYENWSFSNYHFYLVTYIFAVIIKITNIPPIIFSAVINAIASFSTFLLIYLIASKFKFSILKKILIVLIFLLFPPLLGSLSGQYYFDRLYIPLILLLYYLYISNNDNLNNILIIIISLLLFSISERTSLMGGAFLLALFLIGIKEKKYVLLIGIIGVINYFFWKYNIQNSPYSENTSAAQIISNIKDLFNPEMPISILGLRLLIICAPFVIISLFSWKYFLLSVIFLAPNYLVTIGGAEKIGFVTHYHSYYIPVLIIGFINGFSNLSKNKSVSKLTIESLILTTVFLIQVFHYFNIQHVVSPTLSHNLFKDIKIMYKKSDLGQYSDSRYIALKSLFDDVNREAFVSSNEFMQPTLVGLGFVNIRYFPVGVDHSDYLLTESVPDTKTIFLLNIVSDENMPNIQKCLFERANANFKIHKSVIIRGVEFTLWKRN